MSTKQNDAGTLITKESDTHTQYEITTFAGKWRGGKVYLKDKVAQILSGTAILTLELDGRDEEFYLNRDSGEFLIPAGIPNIFYFPELTEMIETFPKDTITQDFKRYREMKK